MVFCWGSNNSWGHLWTASADNSRAGAWFIYFTNDSISWARYDSRALGLSVRCVENFPTFENGFSTSWLEGKTLYDVYQK